MNRFSPNGHANFLVTALAAMSFGISGVSAQSTAQNNAPAETDTVESNQGFALFEAIENSAARSAEAPVRRNNRQSRATVAEPEFTLLGTSRIGDKYTVIIQPKDGEAIAVQADPAASTAIPEHSDYAIVNVASGAVSIRYPGNTDCVEFAERGVSCSEAGNIAELALATGESLPPSSPAPGIIIPIDTKQIVEEVQEEAAETNRFNPRRISPEDVPPGMRVVSTPFGDRLVEQ